MKTTIQEQDGNVVAFLVGNFDAVAVPEAEKAMSPLYDVEGKDSELVKRSRLRREIIQISQIYSSYL